MSTNNLQTEHFSYTELSEDRFREILDLIAKLRKGEISEEVYDQSLTDDEYRNAIMMAALRDNKKYQVYGRK